MTSQFWANVYLNELDQFVKRKLGCRLYLRYVDDLCLLTGDRWSVGTAPKPAVQVTLMNVRAAELVTGVGGAGARPLHTPGDNFLVDLDLGEAALPVGARLRLGGALLEVSALAHTGCGKFSARCGPDALRWVNADAHRARQLRGVNCRVVAPGRVCVGDPVEVV